MCDVLGQDTAASIAAYFSVVSNLGFPLQLYQCVKGKCLEDAKLQPPPYARLPVAATVSGSWNSSGNMKTALHHRHALTWPAGMTSQTSHLILIGSL